MSAATASAVERRSLQSRLRTWARRPDFPLVLMFVGFPVWWLLGLVQPVILVSSGLMVARLLRRRRMRVPVHFSLWVLFLCFVALGAFVVQAEAPGVVTGANPRRQLTWALRFVWYLEATVVLLYVANFRTELSAKRIARVMSVLFVTTVVCGLAGVLAPTLRLTSLFELILPHNLASNAFVAAQIHPVLAEKHVYLGQISYRPSGPFTYANEWGLNYACFLPIFIFGWLGKSSGWRKFVALPVLASSVVPVIYSSNRGLWAVLILMAVVFAAKQARRGNVRLLIGVLIGAVLIAGIIAVSPLGASLADRFSGHNSNEGRTNLSLSSLAAVAQSSPIVGMGTTRDVQGSFYSIAGGSTESCPSCSPPAFGTQGWIWMLLFGHGLVGGVIGLMFFVMTLWRHWRARSPAELTYLCTLIAFLVTIVIYDWSETASFAVMIAISMLGGIASERRPDQSGHVPSGRLRPYASVATVRTALVFCLAGVITASCWQLQHGATYHATAAVWLPEIPERYQLETGASSTLDTQARFAYTSQVQIAARRAAGVSGDVLDGRLNVTAVPNTRILHITYSTGVPKYSIAAANAAAAEVVKLREGRLKAEQTARTRLLTEQVAGIDDALVVVDSDRTLLLREDVSSARTLALASLEGENEDLKRRRSQIRRQIDALARYPITGGAVLAPATATKAPQRWNVAFVSGASLGLVAAALVTGWRRQRGVRVSRLSSRRARQLWSGVNVLFIGDGTDTDGLARGRLATPVGAVDVLACSDAWSTRSAAATLSDGFRGTGASRAIASEGAPPVLVLADEACRTQDVSSTIVRLRAAGVQIGGVLVEMADPTKAIEISDGSNSHQRLSEGENHRRDHE